MKSFAVITVAIVALFIGLAGTVQAELLVNGNFETEPNGTGWSLAGRYDDSALGSIWLAAGIEGSPIAGFAAQNFGTVGVGTYTVSYDGVGGNGTSDTLIALVYYNDAATGWQELASHTAIVGSAQETHTFTFDTLAGQPYTGRPVEIDITAGGNWVALDNVSVTFDAVPEPNVIVLLVTGLIGLLCYAWKKRRS